MERIQGGMMTVTGLHGDGRLGRLLFTLAYYSLWTVGLVVAAVAWAVLWFRPGVRQD
jgi:hypothetical protein